ncbi:MAG: 3-oxoacyl-[acyl-carrier-protein] reductase [Chthonomonadaceae bacterium]|nr:3-oxoacyl-[acyl-carrier-protein] reductase [Chthonomonadaceae bacterium]
MKLAGKIAIVTGAGRGIGRGVALALAAEGASVVVNYSRSAEAAEAVVNQITNMGGTAFAVQGDVASADDMNALAKITLEKYGKIDILVNNAGITRDKLMLRMTEEDWDAVLDTNLKGTFLAVKAVCPFLLKQRSGVIVNVGSVIGKVGGAGQVNYAASKSGLVGLTKSLAKELGGRNIRVNAVAPGFIESDMTDGLKEEHKEAILKQIPLGRLGVVEDVANVVVFLCSDAAAYIQGEVISIDGGLFM